MHYFEHTLTLSSHLDYFEHRGAWFVYHNLFGYIMEMSRDLILFLEFFRAQQRTSEDVSQSFAAQFPPEQLRQFVDVFCLQGCLVSDDTQEWRRALSMFPVLARFVVAHVPPSGSVTIAHAPRDRDDVDLLELDAWASDFVRGVDGETSLQDLLTSLESHPFVEANPALADTHPKAIVQQLAHSQLQFLKFSPRSMSALRAHKSHRAIPPYLRSTMPYRRATDDIRLVQDAQRGERAAPSPGIVTPPTSAPTQTLAGLFARPNPALGGRSYGAALADHAVEHGALKPGARVLQIGARDGFLARGIASVCENLQLVLQVNNPELVPVVRQQLAEANLEAVVFVAEIQDLAESLAQEGFSQSFDWIVCNEFVAQLDTALLHKIPRLSPEKEEDDEESTGTNGHHRPSRDLFMGEGDSVSQVLRYKLQFHDVDGEFLFNTGAVRLLEDATPLLEEHGLFTLIEFGDLYAYPQPSEHNPDVYSLHFAPLHQVGKELGFEARFDWLVHILGFQTESQMLSAPQHQFRALCALVERAGVSLKMQAYTRTMLEQLLDGQIEFATLRGLEFRSLDERVMGIVPSSLKVLELWKAPAQDKEDGDELA